LSFQVKVLLPVFEKEWYG